MSNAYRNQAKRLLLVNVWFEAGYFGAMIPRHNLGQEVISLFGEDKHWCFASLCWYLVTEQTCVYWEQRLQFLKRAGSRIGSFTVAEINPVSMCCNPGLRKWIDDHLAGASDV